MSVRSVLAIGVILLATPALAVGKSSFAPAKDQGTVFQGAGDGTLSSAVGVDWWVSGQPARKFQRVGTIKDARIVEKRTDTAIGAPDIAKLAASKGGTAVIVASQVMRKVPAPVVFALASQNYGPTVNTAAPFDEINTTLEVIKYVE